MHVAQSMVSVVASAQKSAIAIRVCHAQSPAPIPSSYHHLHPAVAQSGWWGAAALPSSYDKRTTPPSSCKSRRCFITYHWGPLGWRFEGVQQCQLPAGASRQTDTSPSYGAPGVDLGLANPAFLTPCPRLGTCRTPAGHKMITKNLML